MNNVNMHFSVLRRTEEKRTYDSEIIPKVVNQAM